jgi:hypothetical protein
MSENFDGGRVRGWELQPGWQVGQYEAGKQGLHGVGHVWANYAAGTWSDFTFSFRLNLVRGAIHVNYRVKGPQRYFIGLREDAISLMKQTGPQQFSGELARSQRPRGVALNQWHTVSVSGSGGQISVTVDGQSALTYADPQPLTQGGIAFETLDDSEAWIDDVAVSLGGAAPTGPIGIVPFIRPGIGPTIPAGPGQVGVTPLPIPKPDSQADLPGASAALMQKPIPGSLVPMLSKPPSRPDMLHSLMADSAGTTLLRSLPGLGNRPLNQLVSTSLSGKPVQQSVVTGAAGPGAGGIDLSPQAIDAVWEAGVEFSPCVPAPKANVGGKVLYLGNVWADSILLHKSLKEMYDEDVVCIETQKTGYTRVATLRLRTPDAPASYMIAARLADAYRGSPASWVKGEKPVAALYARDQSGYRRVPLVPMQDGGGYVAVCYVTPFPAGGAGYMSYGSCYVSLWIDRDAAAGLPAEEYPSMICVFGGFTVTRM